MNIPVNFKLMNQLELKVFPREETGRNINRRLRAAGKIPAVIYGKKGNQPLIIEQNDFRALWKMIAGVSALIQVEVEGKESALSIVKEVQRDPRTDHFIHIDFHEVSATETMHTHVAVRILNEAIGVKNEGGLLEVSAHELEIRCLPRDLPGTIDIDVSELSIGDSIHIRDLTDIKGVEFIGDAELQIVSCMAPAILEEVVEDVAEEGELEEGEEMEEGEAGEPKSEDKGVDEKSESAS